jgi:hypothetical protein
METGLSPENKVEALPDSKDERVIDILLTPAVFVGFLCGFAVALLFHWMVPATVDTGGAGAWFIAIGIFGGLLWSAFVKKFKD